MFSGMFRRRQAVDPAAAESPGSYEVPLYTNAAYYPNWRIYKKQPPSSLRLGFISHIFYAFAWYAANHLRAIVYNRANLDMESLQGEGRWHNLCKSDITAPYFPMWYISIALIERPFVVE